MSFYAIESAFSPNTQKNIGGICSSSDFQKVYLAYGTIGFVTGGPISISYDSGITWTNASITGNWSDICCSSDGKYVYAVMYGNSIYYSTNYGISFTSSGQPNRNWYGCCCSADGTIIYACVLTGGIYAFTNTNITTVNNTSVAPSVSPTYWYQICCSDDGTKIAVTNYTNHVYVSNSPLSTTSWTQITTTARNWSGIQCNTDRTRIVASIYNAGTGAANGLYKFEYNGSTWTATQLGTTTIQSGAYAKLGLSRDFKNIITADNNTSGNKKWYYSTDYGNTWTSVDYGALLWTSAYVCNNKFVMLPGSASYVWIGQFYPDPSLYTIGGASFGEIVAPAMTYGSNTGRVMTSIQDGVLPYYSWAFNQSNSTTWNNPVSYGMNNSLTLNRAGPTTDITYTYTNPAGSASYAYNNIDVDTTTYLLINNSTSYSGGKGAQAYLQCGVNYLKSFSISFWILPSDISYSNTYISLLNFTNGNSTGCIDIGIDGNDKKVVFVLNNDYANNKAFTSTVLTANQYWYHITATYNSATGYMYLYVNYNNSRTVINQDSSVIRKDLDPGIQPNTYSVLLIGIRYGYNAGPSGGHIGYNGLISNLNIYPREITAGEVQQLYASGKNVFSTTNPVPTTDLTLNNYFKSTNTDISKLPLVKGQGFFGDSPYSRVQFNNYYNLTVSNISMNQDSYPGMFAPYYTVYNVPNTYTHNLQPWTKRIFVIAVGGGGGGAGGNFNNGSSVGAGGSAGGGGGMAYSYYDVSDGIGTLSIVVGQGGLRGEITPASLTGYYVGGSGQNGSSSTITYNSITICNGNYGTGGKNKLSTILPTSTTSTNNYFSGAVGTKGLYGSVSNLGVSGGTNGTNGTAGASAGNVYGPNGTCLGGTGGKGGNGSGIQVNSEDVILNWSGAKFINKTNGSLILTGTSFRTDYGSGGNGGLGEGAGASSNNQTPGYAGQGGLVLIFEYAI